MTVINLVLGLEDDSEATLPKTVHRLEVSEVAGGIISIRGVVA